MTTNTDVTQAQIADLAAVEITCGTVHTTGDKCSGPQPRFPWARVECANNVGAAWPHSHGEPEHNKYCWGSSQERCNEHRANCSGYRVATLEEIKLKLDDLIIKYEVDIETTKGHENGDFRAILHTGQCGMGNGPTEAFVKAVHAAWKAEAGG